MHYFIDEAGDFTLPDSPETHRVAVASCVAFTDAAWSVAEPRFSQFLGELDRTELDRSEPRWHLLRPEHRTTFTELLASIDGVSLTPVTLDLSHLVGIDDSGETWLTKLDHEPERMLYETMRNEIRLLGKQARNLSRVQQLRIYAWAYCLHQALYHSIIFLGHGADASSWDTVSIIIDPVQPRAGNREQRVFSLMVLAWLMGWSRDRPFITVQGIHTPEHRFMQLYDRPEGIDLGKLVRGNLHWIPSQKNLGLQIADLTASAVYTAATELKGGSESLEHFRSLMRSSFYGPVRGPGLFSPLASPPQEAAARYEVLSDAMRSTGRRGPR
jgi:hypothetical protein